ncbi:ATP-binding cassette domain-containing protein [Blastococcus brunescens]|uniref:ATP-binding cassette domain-containing protein n=1 Tax=Blastococcus brunescens TaxID=1564165 RepID=A0ABZ1AYE0_9ACTN|nr:ATP-binding cassette domain-containing protein [Blastococcus sp. BMG 8361]WRL63579.1 ATP-binding cassette domain-containing protein [Blastococcus sp. BMG 8361]
MAVVGGMQQRVAIARAISYRPEILLMDEPFASVDAQTRIELEDLILRVRDSFGMTVLFVTHDIDEAVYLADRVIILTRPPTRVQEVLSVPLPRPRHQTTTKELSDYVRLRGMSSGRSWARTIARPKTRRSDEVRTTRPRALTGRGAAADRSSSRRA